MLVLSRKERESIILELPNGEQVIIKLLKYLGQLTQVGIDAPQDVEILREELLIQGIDKLKICYFKMPKDY